MSSTPRVFVGPATVRIAGAVDAPCLDAVQASLHLVPGLRAVAVDHRARTVTVVADRPVDRTDVDAAVSRTGHRTLPLH